MRYTILNSNDIPYIVPDTPYIILQNGSLILQGFGIIGKFDTQKEAEDFCNSSPSFKKWDKQYHKTKKIVEDNYKRYIDDCNSRDLPKG